MSVRPIPQEVVDEFEVLVSQLDTGMISRSGWSRLKTILTLATLEAGDIESGRAGYANSLIKWKLSRHYDGSD